MNADHAIEDLVRRIGQGDTEAANELVRTHQPRVRLEVQLRLRCSGLRGVLESEDICQAVFASLVVGLRRGDHDIRTPDDLIHLLSYLVRNKMIDLVRFHCATRRDRRRTVSLHRMEDRLGMQARYPTPADEAILKDLHQHALSRLSKREREIADQRSDGASWAEIAAGLRLSPNAVRKRLKRAVDRIAAELELTG